MASQRSSAHHLGMVLGILVAQGIAQIDFVHWMKLGLPVAAVGLVLAWGLLLAIFRPQVRITDDARAMLRGFTV